MCARIAYLILAALFTFIVVTVAAFVYLEWWQALLASATTFLLIVIGARFLVHRTIGNMMNLAKGMFDGKSSVLRNSTADIHSVKPTEIPKSIREWAAKVSDRGNDDDFDDDDRADAQALLHDSHWVEIEATIFPDASQAKEMQLWDVDDLRLVPFDAAESAFGNQDNDDDAEFELHDLVLMRDGEAIRSDDSKLQGPQRVRFKVGVPRDVRELKFKYYFEQFGHIKLPTILLLPPRNPR